MKKATYRLGNVLVVAALAGAPVAGWAQVDPYWLRSWNEAEASRPAETGSSSRIAAADEPGVPFVIRGQVVTPDGAPAGGVVVHAYHRDRDGYDFGPGDNALTTWRLQGWVETDQSGRFEFRTIRPAADHLGREAAHIHFTLVSDDYGRQWAPTIYLSDDPLVTKAQRRQSEKAGVFGGVREVEIENGTQTVEVRFRLSESGDF